MTYKELAKQIAEMSEREKNSQAMFLHDNEFLDVEGIGVNEDSEDQFETIPLGQPYFFGEGS